MLRGVWWLVWGMLVVCGCGSWTLRRQATPVEAPPPAPPQPYAWQEEGSFPAAPAVPAEPAGAAREADAFAADSLPGRDDGGTFGATNPDFSVEALPAAEAPAGLAAAPDVQAPLLDGYRVQVFATRSQETAERLRGELTRSLGVATYLDFDDPYFKIRAGDCRSESECRLLQEQLRNAGYPAAFVVPARIVAP